jgi:hypothetical protein
LCYFLWFSTQDFQTKIITAQYIYLHKKQGSNITGTKSIKRATTILVVRGFNLVLKEALLTDVFRGLPQENVEFEATSKWASTLLPTTTPRQYDEIGQQISLHSLQILNTAMFEHLIHSLNLVPSDNNLFPTPK